MVKSPTAMTLAVGVLLGGERGNGVDTNAVAVEPQGQLSVMTAVPAANREPREMVVITARFLAGIIPIRRKILSSKLDRSRRTSSWNQGHSGTVALDEP